MQTLDATKVFADVQMMTDEDEDASRRATLTPASASSASLGDTTFTQAPGRAFGDDAGTDTDAATETDDYHDTPERRHVDAAARAR